MTVATHSFAAILEALTRHAGQNPEPEELMQAIVKELSRIPYYNWVGFYMRSRSDPNMLELGPFVGTPTPHVRIPVDRGICGAAVTAGETIVVDDVAADPRYLACSLATKSEIVAPIFAHGRGVGELDIDSHTAAAFAEDDRAFIEECAALVGRRLEALRP